MKTYVVFIQGDTVVLYSHNALHSDYFFILSILPFSAEKLSQNPVME